MKLLHNIGTYNHSNYTTKEKILECNDEISFDGVYRNIYENRDILKGKKGILFIMGNFIGKDNSFDLENVPQLEQFCSWDEIFNLLYEIGFELGWHTWSHRDLTTLPDEEVIKEITPPFKMKYFAYPYGKYDERVKELVKQAGYEKAYSVDKTDGCNFTIKRDYI